MFPFHVMGGKDVRAVIDSSHAEIYAQVRETYLAHHRGETINPNSYFLRFPDKPDARIIALPALVRGNPSVAGLKWIGSFPENIEHNVPRASAVLILNDFATGYPFACIEASQISAARTAASAVLGAELLQGARRADKVAVIGAGVISRTILEFFRGLGWDIGEVAVHDRVEDYARRWARRADESGYQGTVCATLPAAVEGADVVVLATTTAEPYLTDTGLLAPGQNVLNVSLRDLGPQLVLGSHNILDDVEHCLTARTSPHLAELECGHRRFIDGTLAQLMLGEVTLTRDKPRIFSPFGLGVLDIAVGLSVLRAGLEAGTPLAVPDFFAEVARW
ncbi:2,3-diaminopropionate biosynthesis protein SbnB [Streptomyces sp. NPDC006602]|uniref:2,3-diaminopropionate biosynthesis protein SbnB n=1 Tax=Streptomyces sp. NPDC006602 TaxID=3364751 RepID=UPI00367CC871